MPPLAEIDGDLLEQLRFVAQAEKLCAGLALADADHRRLVSELGALSLPQRAAQDIERRDCFIAAAGREIPLRLYGKWGLSAAPSRLLLYFHGGGWMTGSLATHDLLCGHLAALTGYMVASVHYRRAPENPHPAAHEDCWAAARWLRRHAKILGCSDDMPMAIGGDSAGAHLALGCVMRALRDASPAFDRMLLFYPPLTPDAKTGSLREFRNGPGLTAEAMRHYWRTFSGGENADAEDALLFPLAWKRMAELPPSVIMTAEHDILRDEGEGFAQSLRDAGVPVSYTRATGMIHGFARMLTASPRAYAYVQQACRELLSIL
ncbi:alpha/beta hydrolase [Pollutimonas bauzanensis]|uniref:Acetyl esterase n=1 Tax=Pollutimonas bauzanensis TaxID=658167 RepID=A0A1M5ZG60_9BURK|nr:alpha/beta hydrolase [Pollutimonas bauzanensis]SHI22883.1 acetyl esterase [Pollutimonas bauzanensis]